MNGILLVDKPSGMTSHDVVARIRKVGKTKKVGHTGTLDPGATGLLILCIGAATRLSDYLTGMDKVYAGEMTFGLVTDSFDADGNVREENDVPEITESQLQSRMEHYTGTFDQVPPMVSAVKVGGKRLYKMAREGKEVERPAREITVSEFRLEALELPKAVFTLSCVSGTYVRSLCHDIGQDLGCGAILSQLRRVQVGDFHVDDSIALDALEGPEDIEARLVPMSEALDLPTAVLNGDGLRLVLSGNQINPKQLLEPPPEEPGRIQLKSRNGHLIALADLEHRPTGTWIQPRKVFPLDD